LRNYIERLRKSEKGFTLIELLVVIVILGILAAVVVFAVGGLQDKGSKSACQTDTKTLRTAEEAYFSQETLGNSLHYANQTTAKVAGDLVSSNLLANPPKYHSVSVTPGAAGAADTYAISIEDAKCGKVGDAPGQAANDY
jgi:general secretion pathway protein G